MTTARREGREGLAVVLAVLFALDGLLWLAAAGSAWLDGGRLPAGICSRPWLL